MNAPGGLGPGWQDALRQDWIAVPAREILDPVAGYFTAHGFNPMTSAEGSAFAVYARLFKHGMSQALMLPAAGGDTLLHLSYYLHRLRQEAMQDVIRAPWLNYHCMRERPHLVVLTRPLIRHHQLARESDLHTTILRSSTPAALLSAARLATLLVGSDADPAAALQLIASRTRPFAFVIDATPSGVGEGACALLAALAEQFPDVPRVTLAALGDPVVTAGLAQCKAAGHLWHARLGDAMPVNAASSPPSQFVIAAVADPITNASLASAFAAVQTLREACQHEPAPLRATQLPPLSKVLNQLRSVFVPLAALEEQLTRDTRPGRFPILSLHRWLDKTASATFQYGVTHAAHAAAVAAVRLTYDQMLIAVTGREQALLALLDQCCAKRGRVGILVGTQIEVCLLQAVLDRHVECSLHDQIVLQAMDCGRINALGATRFQHILVMGTLWPSRLHWLGLDSERMTVVCYPFEQSSTERQVQRWWMQHGAPSPAHGDKKRFWQLDCSEHRLLDAAVALLQSPPVSTSQLAHVGVHPKGGKAVEILAPDRHEDWMAYLMAPPDEASAETEADASPQDPYVVWVHTEEHAQPIAWPRSRTALVLQAEEIVARLPEQLVPGDEIIMLVNNEERIATQASLFELFVAESTGLDQFVQIADKWQGLIDTARVKLKTLKALRAKFKAGGVDVTDQTVRNWVQHQVIGPLDGKAIQVLTQYLELKSPDKLASHIHRAIEKVRAQRRAIGRDMTAAILERRAGADTVSIGKMKLNVDALDGMVEVCRVLQIVLPPLVPQPVNDTLADVVARIMTLHPGRLWFTSAATRSLAQCQFKDAAHFGDCLALMATQLHDMYFQKISRIDEVLKAFTNKQVSFAPKMAATTQGRFDVYQRLYHGKRVDIGKHFRLGANYDPTRTMRIHFHVDESDQLVVIHHAGVHLPTNAD